MMKNRKIIIAILFVLIICCIGVLTACKNVSMQLTFIVDGEEYKTIDTAGNEMIAIPQSPVKDGYTFDGWYWDEGTWQHPFTANSLLNEPLTADMSVYAKFTEIHEHSLIPHAAVEAKCDQLGNETYYTCTCGKIFADVNAQTELLAIPTLEMTAHTPSEWIVDKDATCTLDGLQHKECLVCHTTLQTETIESNGHTPESNWRIDRNADCLTAGSKHLECSVCHETVESETIPAIGHSYSKTWSQNDEYHWHQSTCGHDVKQDYAKHTLKNGVCFVCGFDQHANEAEVKVYIDGTYQQSVYTGESKNFTITAPEKPEDITTNPNAERYFYGWFVDSNFQTPLFDTTTFENGGAIYGKWFSVYFSQFVYTVSNGQATITATTLSDNSTVVVVPAYLNSFPVVKINPLVFYGKTALRTVILCNGIEELGANIFANCNSLEEIHIPQSVSKIGNNAFQNCNLLSSVRMKDLQAWKEIEFGNTYSDPTYKGAQLYENNEPVYQLAYNLSGGTVATANEKYYKADSSFALNEPTKTDYEFIGWTYDDVTTPVKNLRIENMTGNKTLVANWKYVKFNISYNLDGGVNNSKNPAIYSKLGDDVQIAEPTKRGYDFIGWTGGKWQTPTKQVVIESGSEGDVELTANWQIVIYSITYNLNGGEYNGEKTEQYTVTDNLTLFKPTRDYYTFAGWTSTDITSATQNVSISNAIGDRTYTATWTPISYSITYNLGGGTHSNPASYTVESRITLNAPTKTGYTFTGWTGTGLDEETINVSFSNEHVVRTYTAHWSLNTYTIAYELNGGQNAEGNPLSYTYLDNVTLQQPTRDYYAFAGWTGTGLSSANKNVTINKSTGNKTYTATWTPIKYTITYILDGGVNDSANPAQYTVESNTLTLSAPTKADYTFIGWYVDDNEVTEIVSGSSGDITLTAKWAKYVLSINQTTGGSINLGVASHNVTFNSNANDVAAPSSQTVTSTVGLKYPSIPTRSGYVFAGWYDNAACNGNPYDFTKTVKNDLTLYAKWIAYSGQGVLNLNSSLTVSCVSRSTATYRYYAFVPLVDGNVTIYTTGNVDTYGFLFNANKQQLKADDDSGSGYNFSITYNVTAGTLYYVRPCGYNSAVTTTVNISASLPNAGGKLENVVNNNGGVTAGREIELKVQSTHEAYDWLGWYNGDTLLTNERTYKFVMPDENMTITAKWQPKTYVITYEGTRNAANSNPTSYTIETETFALQGITYNGYSFLGWKQGEQTISEIAKGMYGDITLTASWTSYKLNDIEYDTAKCEVSVNDVIDGKLFNVRCLDTDGNYAAITAEVNGQQVAGGSITIMFTAELNGRSKALTLNNIKVYGEPTLTYDNSVNYINLDDELTSAWFKASSTDTFGNAVDVTAEIVGEYNAGDVVSVILSATDIAGNTVTATLNGICVYGKPVITYNETITDVKGADRMTAEYFSATAVDSFGEPLTVKCSYSNFVIGRTATVKFTATDSNGNVQTVTTDVNVYGKPTFTDVVKTDYSVTDIVTVDNLGVVAADTYGKELNITLTLKNGVWRAGNVVTYTLTATDIAGNVAAKDVVVKVYGNPTITVGNTDIKSTDGIFPATFDATAADSFGNALTLTIAYISGDTEHSAVRKYLFTATDASGNVTEIAKDVKVYFASDITLDYERFGDAMIKKTSKGEEFFAYATDGFGNNCELSIEVANGFTLAGGQIVDLYIVATDNAGNAIRSDKITGIRVYDTPTAVLQQEVIYEDTNFRFLYFVYDSFGSQLAANITVQGEVAIGNTVNVRIIATDDIGNTLDVIYQHTIYDENFTYIKDCGLLTITSYIGNSLSVTIPDYADAIGDNAFANTNLTQIILCGNLSYIGNNAFSNCNAQIETPQRAGYISILVNEEKQTIDVRNYCGNVEVQFETIIYTITYELNGGNNNNANPSTYTIESDNIVLLAAPTRTGYTFAGWSDNGIITSGSIGDKTFVANWTAIEYSISYVLNGGTNSSDNPSKYTIESESITLSAPAREGYTFIGWTKNGVIVHGSQGDKTFVASWQANINILSFDGNGSIRGEMISLNVATDEVITLPSNQYQRDDAFFVGWASTFDGEVVYEDNAEIVMDSKNVVLYAIWQCLDVKLNLVENGYVVTGLCNENAAEVFIPSLFNEIPIVSIKSNAFKDCVNLVSIILPDSIEYMGVSAFNNCKGLTSIIIPTGITCIENAIFYGCSNLENITIPSTVSTIGVSAFYNCGRLSTVFFDGDLKDWLLIDGLKNLTNYSSFTLNLNNQELSDVVVIPNGITKINDGAFRSLKNNITEVIVPDGVVSIGVSAFQGCKNLTKITVPDSVVSMGKSAFGSCENLTGVFYTGNIDDWSTITFEDIPANPLYYAHNLYINDCLAKQLIFSEGMQEIKSYAFANCTCITDVNIPYSVVSIQEDAFKGCNELVNVRYDGDVSRWCNIDFATAYSNPMCYAQNLYIGNELIVGSLTIPSTVIKIKPYAFANCSNLTSVVIPNSVTSICAFAFYSCSALPSIDIPDSIISIEMDAFNGCSNIEEITIPNSVISIGSGAFAKCTGLSTVTIGRNVNSIGRNAFQGCEKLKKVNFRGSIEDWCNINFENNTSNPLCYAHNLYIDDSLVEKVIIADTITEIKSWTFYKCNSITNVEISEGVLTIGGWAFQYCENLQTVIIPQSVTTIGPYAFMRCNNIQGIYYAGSDEELQNVSIGSSSLSRDFYYSYSETEPALNADGTNYDGNYWYYDDNNEIVVWTYNKEND